MAVLPAGKARRPIQFQMAAGDKLHNVIFQIKPILKASILCECVERAGEGGKVVTVSPTIVRHVGRVCRGGGGTARE